MILSPFDDLPSPIVLSGWNVQLAIDSADDPRVATFFEEYWKSNDVPEPGALCTGAYDAPGKASARPGASSWSSRRPSRPSRSGWSASRWAG